MRGLLILCTVCALTSTTTAYESCMYQLDQCFRRAQSMEETVNRLATNVNQMEGRQAATVQAMSGELSKLEMDSRAVKTVVSTLVEDNVRVSGEIRGLHGVGEDVRAIRNKVNEVESALKRDMDGQQHVSVHLNTQISNNKMMLDNLQNKLRQVEEKVKRLEATAGNGGSQNLQGRLDEAEARLNQLEAMVNRPGAQ